MNYIIIVSDGLRADYGYNHMPKTREFFEKYGGYKFTNCYATTNWTIASLMSIHTGMLPSNNGLWDISYGMHVARLSGRGHLAFKAVNCLDEDFMLSKMKALGYTTQYLGVRRMWAFMKQTVNHLYDINTYYNWQFMHLDTWQNAEYKEPFFLFSYTTDGGHDPYGVSPRGFEVIPGRGRYDGQSNTCFSARYIENHRARFNRKRIDELMINQCRQYDDKMETFYKWFVDSGLYKNTTLIFTSDHGEGLWEHPGVFGHARCLYEEEIRVPLYIYYPPCSKYFTVGIQEKSYLTSLLDIMPTAMDVDKIHDGIHLFRPKKDRPIFSEFTRYVRDKNVKEEILVKPSPQDFIRTVRLGDYKLIFSRDISGSTALDLYDLSLGTEAKHPPSGSEATKKKLYNILIDKYNITPDMIKYKGRLEEVIKMEKDSIGKPYRDEHSNPIQRPT
jgi:arylsulfatase A-like enzyme